MDIQVNKYKNANTYSTSMINVRFDSRIHVVQSRFVTDYFELRGNDGAHSRIKGTPTELRQLAYNLLTHAEGIDDANRGLKK